MRGREKPKEMPLVAFLLECGDWVWFRSPYPEPHEELTCGVCGEPTEVAA